MKLPAQSNLSSSWKQRIVTILVFGGILLQINEYIANRSLWFDELNVANHILSNGILEILTAQNFGYPPGFVIIERIATYILGGSEFALRLFPLVCGILSVALFPKIVGRFADANTTVIGTALFALSFKLIYYATEVKPYILDILIALVLLNIFVDFYQNDRIKKHLFKYAFLGCAAILFSTRAILILGGAGAILLMKFWREKKTVKAKLLAFLVACWAGTFLLYYALVLRRFLDSYNLAEWDAVRTAPPAIFSLDAVTWLCSNAFYALLFPLTYEMALAQFLFIAGLIFLFSKDAGIFGVMTAPILLTVVLSFFGYPLYDRLLLFLMPLLIVIIAFGVNATSTHPAVKYKKILAFFCLFFLMRPSLLATTLQFTEEYAHEEIKPVLEVVRKNILPDDVMYVYYGASPAFEYYAGRYQLNNGEVIDGVFSREDRTKYLDDIKLISQHARVWVLFSHIYKDEDLFFLDNIKEYGGEVIDFFQMAPKPHSTPFAGRSFVVLYVFKSAKN